MRFGAKPLLGAFAAAFALHASAADPAPGPNGTVPANPVQTGATCSPWTSEYALSARLRLQDTPFGAGDGTYDIGPGRLVLRFYSSPAPGAPARVELLTYEMRDHFVVESHVLFFKAKVTTRTETRVTPDAKGTAAVGALVGKELRWSTRISGYRTDGTLTCEGSGCGLPGAPSSGTSPLHIGPGPVDFKPFVFSSDSFETFTMTFAKVSHTDNPKQTAFVTIAGRKMNRKCAPP